MWERLDSPASSSLMPIPALSGAADQSSASLLAEEPHTSSIAGPPLIPPERGSKGTAGFGASSAACISSDGRHLTQGDCHPEDVESQIMYVELKSGLSRQQPRLDRPCRLLSKTGRTIYYRGKSLQRIPGGGISGACAETDAGASSYPHARLWLLRPDSR